MFRKPSFLKLLLEKDSAMPFSLISDNFIVDSSKFHYLLRYVSLLYIVNNFLA